MRETLDRYRAVLGENHRFTLGAMNNLSSVLQRQGRRAEAEPFSAAALSAATKTLGDEHPSTFMLLGNHAGLLVDNGRIEEAEHLYRRALLLSRPRLGVKHSDTLHHLANYAGVLLQMGRAKESLAVSDVGLRLVRSTPDVNHDRAQFVVNTHLRALEFLGESDRLRSIEEEFASLRPSAAKVTLRRTDLTRVDPQDDEVAELANRIIVNWENDAAWAPAPAATLPTLTP